MLWPSSNRRILNHGSKFCAKKCRGLSPSLVGMFCVEVPFYKKSVLAHSFEALSVHYTPSGGVRQGLYRPGGPEAQRASIDGGG